MVGRGSEEGQQGGYLKDYRVEAKEGAVGLLPAEARHGGLRMLDHVRVACERFGTRVVENGQVLLTRA